MAGPLGNITGGVVGAGVGIAASNVAEPILEVERQQAWKDNAFRVLELGDLARLVAQGLAKLDDAAEHALRNGFDQRKLAARVQLELHAPSVAETLELWRRNASRPPDEQISEAQVNHALAKAQIEPQYWPAIKELFSERLDPAVIATAVQRGIMKDPGFLPVGPPTTGGRVPAFPVSKLDPIKEAASSGINAERLFIETAIVGNPASPDLAARLVFRDLMDRVDFDRAIAEGNTRNEWADVLFEGFRQIVTAHDGIEGRLRGWLTDGEMYAQTARHGMSKEDTDLLFKITGRPPSWHQVWIGLQRGGVYDGPIDMIDKPFLKALQESNLRPEWYNLLWHSRYNYPAPFVLRGLAQAHDLTADETEEILKFEGWEPTLRAKVAKRWAASKAASQKEATVTDLLTLYDGGYLDTAPTLAAITDLGYPPDEAQTKLDLVDARRAASAKNTAISWLGAAFKKGDLDGPSVDAALNQLGLNPLAIGQIVAAWQTYRDAFPPPPPPVP